MTRSGHRNWHELIMANRVTEAKGDTQRGEYVAWANLDSHLVSGLETHPNKGVSDG